MASTHEHETELHDTPVVVHYTYSPEEPPERERGGGNYVYPGAPEGVTVEEIRVVDPVAQKLRRALAAMLPYAESRIEDMADHAETACATLIDRAQALAEVDAVTKAGAAFEQAKQLLAETHNHIGPELDLDFLTPADTGPLCDQLLEAVHDQRADEYEPEDDLEDDDVPICMDQDCTGECEVKS